MSDVHPTRTEAIAEAIRESDAAIGDTVTVHRDLGPTFLHVDLDTCPCSPTKRELRRGMSADDVARDIAEHEAATTA
jgi:hypothetical protein